MSIFSIYAPVQQGRINSQRTNQFYETLTTTTKEAEGRGDLVIIGGGWNAGIQQQDAPGLIGKWASSKTSTNSENMINFMLEQKLAAANTFKKIGWRNRYTWSRGQSKTMIDFFLFPMHMLHWHYESEHRCGKWNMHSDHRTIHLRLPETTQPKKKGRTPKKKKRGQGSKGIRRESGRSCEPPQSRQTCTNSTNGLRK